ncbi:hypothetical protein [Prauserella alba]|uniref:Uncharacterized protein n=1 Tax=Prauserella alba TaxID=176898 RepID=A0ABP4G421_9PSEU|nr:hypothetical protein [Prauserella alba]MCP2181910.1 hypothetical protein [Prauserella alba]
MPRIADFPTSRERRRPPLTTNANSGTRNTSPGTRNTSPGTRNTHP